METSLREKVYNHIRCKIKRRELTAGNRLEEVKLAKEIGVSRAPVREAMCRLESEGVLCQVPRLGTFVKAPSRKEICDWWELRASLEGCAAEKVAAAGTGQAVEEIISVHREMLQMARKFRSEGAVSMTESQELLWEQADLNFHMAIVQGMDNQAVDRMISNLHIMDGFLEPSRGEPDRVMVVRVCGEHGKILRAVRNREPVVARQEMVSHLMRARQIVLNEFSSERSRMESWSLASTYALMQNKS